MAQGQTKKLSLCMSTAIADRAAELRNRAIHALESRVLSDSKTAYTLYLPVEYESGDKKYIVFSVNILFSSVYVSIEIQEQYNGQTTTYDTYENLHNLPTAIIVEIALSI